MTPENIAGGVFFIFASTFYLASSTLRLWEHKENANKWVLRFAVAGAIAWIVASACAAEYLQTGAASAYFIEAMLRRIEDIRAGIVALLTLLGAFLWVTASLRDNNDLQDVASISYAAAAICRTLTLICAPKSDLGFVVASCFSIFGSFMWFLMSVLLFAE